MNWTITYFSESVQYEILAMPAGLLARYLRYTDRMEIYGPDLGMPHTRAMGDGLFELRLKASEGIASFFLHDDWPQDCDLALFHQKNQQDTTKRAGYSPTANERG